VSDADHTAALSRAAQLLRTDTRAALDLARQALDASLSGGDEAPTDPATYQRWLLVKGAAQSRLGDTEDGARVLREVRTWAEEHADRALLASSHRRLSELFRRVGDPALMLEHAVTAVELLDPDATDAVRADHLLGLADALGANGSFEDSVVRYHEAARLAQGCGDSYLQLAVLNNLAYTEYECGLSAQAVVTAERLLAEAARTGYRLQAHDGDTVARAYTAVGRLADAAAIISPFCEGPLDGTSSEDCDGLVMALLTLCEVLRLSGDHDGAQACLDRADVLVAKYSLTGRSVDALGQQAELHAARGHHRQAFETHREFHRADVELRALDRAGRARTLNAIFEATEARRSSEYFRELSGRDPLTGLHNRRHLDERLDALLGGLDPAGAGLTVGLVDLDHFKRINDTLSHAVGDEVLRQVATLLQDAVRDVPGGLAVRMGGEEFLVLLPEHRRGESTARFEDLRTRIASHAWAEVTNGTPVTASIGVACAPVDATTRKSLVAHADRNLYRAKDAGRDQVVA
jgi:two-component system cell cycle response regulator